MIPQIVTIYTSRESNLRPWLKDSSAKSFVPITFGISKLIFYNILLIQTYVRKLYTNMHLVCLDIS